MSRVVAFGEIMLRLAAPGFQRFQQALPGALQATFAGAEASIAASLAHLGVDAGFVTALPDNPIADACLADLRSIGVNVQQIVRTAEGRLGVYFLEHGCNQRGGAVIYDRAGSAVAITPATAYDWPAAFSGCEWFVLSGITPAISRNAAEVALAAVQQASSRGVGVLFDANYRTKLWQWEPALAPRELATQTLRGLMPYVNVFVGGLSDVAAMLDVEPSGAGPEAVEAAVRQIAAQYPQLTHVALTLRDGSSATLQRFGGALYESSTGRLCYAPQAAGEFRPYEIAHVVDRLGAGDAFTAGLLFAFLHQELADPQSAIAFAAAAGCLAHSIEGDFNYSTRAEIEALMQGAATGRVSR